MTMPRMGFAKHDIDGRSLGRIVDTLIDRMGAPLRPYQRAELRAFLVERLWWGWPAETLREVEAALRVAKEETK